MLFRSHNRDENGFVLPFEISPFDIHIIKIGDSSEICKYVNSIKKALSERRYQVKIDSNGRLGKSRQEWELKGYPIKIEVGKREVENDDLPLWHRWKSKQKYAPESIPADNLLDYLDDCKSQFSEYLKRKTKKVLDQTLVNTSNPEDLKEIVSDGFVGVFNWCGNDKCIENMYGIQNLETKEREDGLVSQGKFIGWNPNKPIEGKCISCEESANREGYWSRRKHI